MEKQGVAMTPIGPERLSASTVPGRTSHQKEIGRKRYASLDYVVRVKASGITTSALFGLCAVAIRGSPRNRQPKRAASDRQSQHRLGVLDLGRRGKILPDQTAPGREVARP